MLQPTSPSNTKGFLPQFYRRYLEDTLIFNNKQQLKYVTNNNNIIF